MEKALGRVEREIGIPGLAALLAEKLSPTDLQTLLLEVSRLSSQRRQPAAVLADYEANRFVRPSSVAPARLLEWERTAFASLPPEVVPLALSPVAPLGASSAVALVDQNRVLSTIRNTEVVSDSTNVLALEAAVRRRQILRANPKAADAVHLAASHRLLRTQQFAANPQLVPHFSAFALCSAGRDRGDLRFELEALALHTCFYLRALRAFLGAERLRLTVTDFGEQDRRALIASRLFAAVQAEFPAVACDFDQQRESGRDYYVDLCFHIEVYTAAGQALQLGDGGVVDWTQKLLSSAKERCVISGVGSERVCMDW